MNTQRYTISRGFAKSKGIPRTFIADIERQTQKAIKVKGRGTIDAHVGCMMCGRELTHPVSRVLGIGPECGKHFYDVELTEANIEQLKQMIVDTAVDTWIPKKCVIKTEPTNELIGRPQTPPLHHNIVAKEIPMTIFNYHKDDETFSQEISTLQGNGFDPFSQVYEDACDEGFTMVSEQTGRKVTFYLDDVGRDGEREITRWSYMPTPESVRQIPGIENLKVIIFND